jgi:hypothetical protein
LGRRVWLAWFVFAVSGIVGSVRGEWRLQAGFG